LTIGIRIELHHQGALVVTVHASFIDTDMAALVDASTGSPEPVAQQAFDAVEAGEIEVLADERSRFVKASLSRDHEPIYPPVQASLMLRSRAPRSARQVVGGTSGPGG
jgi:NAD(P)-dependent dehydrogenase (short-subunit alcohol dehydrogenase family)